MLNTMKTAISVDDELVKAVDTAARNWASAAAAFSPWH
jgi:hypothetical protein